MTVVGTHLLMLSSSEVRNVWLLEAKNRLKMLQAKANNIHTTKASCVETTLWVNARRTADPKRSFDTPHFNTPHHDTPLPQTTTPPPRVNNWDCSERQVPFRFQGCSLSNPISQ